jgi:hypothetical protein
MDVRHSLSSSYPTPAWWMDGAIDVLADVHPAAGGP